LRDAVSDHWSSIDDPNREVYWAFIDAICDQALQSLSQEAVRDEALEEAAKVCEGEITGGDYSYLAERGYFDHMAQAAMNCAKAIRALKREPNAPEQPYRWTGEETTQTTSEPNAARGDSDE
jgi:hypothetical protein